MRIESLFRIAFGTVKHNRNQTESSRGRKLRGRKLRGRRRRPVWMESLESRRLLATLGAPPENLAVELEQVALIAGASLTATSMNHPPVLVANDPPVVLEDQGPQTIASLFTFSPGDPSESDQNVLAYHVLEISQPALFSVQPTIDTAGVLTFTTAENVFGSSTLVVTVQDDGGTANGGVDTSLPQTITITVTGVNDAPSFMANETILAREDDPAETVADFATEFHPGPWEDGTSPVTVTAHDEGPSGDQNPFSTDHLNPTQLGTFEHGSNLIHGFIERAKTVGDVDVFTFSIDPGFQLEGLFLRDYQYVSLPTSDRAAFLAINDGVSFPYDASGLDINANPFFDETLFLGGTVFGLDDLPSAGGGNLLPRAGVITGRGFTGPLPAGTYTIYIQQTGPANRYTLDFQITSIDRQHVAAYLVDNVSNPALFSEPPRVDSMGTLTFTPSPDSNGVATFDVVVQDDGGTENGGIDRSTVHRATITVASVNDAPSFSAIDPPPVNENSGPQIVPGFITAFVPGPANESQQSIQEVRVSNISNPTLFQSPPSINTDGDLTYTLAQDVSGTTTFDVVVRDSGGTANGGIDVSVPQTFTLQVIALVEYDYGDAPATFPVLQQQQGARHVVGSLRLGTLIDSESDGQPSPDANGDGDDDDGVLVIADAIATEGATTTASLQVIATGSGKLNGWIDLNSDGDWSDLGEHIIVDQAVGVGSTAVAFDIPAGSIPSVAAARFRLNSDGALSPIGDATDGEVEDYLITLKDGAAGAIANVSLVQPQATIATTQQTVQIDDGQITLLSVPAPNITELVVTATDQDDEIVLDASGWSRTFPIQIHGGGGHNQLIVRGPIAIDLRDQWSLTQFQAIDLTGPESTVLTVDTITIRALDSELNPVDVSGGSGDRIVFADPQHWRMGAPVMIDNQFLRTVVRADPMDGSESVRLQLPAPWQNVVRPSDVDNNGVITTLDALIVVGEFSRRRFSDSQSQQLADPVSLSQWPNLYLDQNGDGLLTPLDALRVINEIAILLPGVEGEIPRFAYDMAVRQVIDEFDSYPNPIDSAIDASTETGKMWAARAPVRSLERVITMDEIATMEPHTLDTMDELDADVIDRMLSNLQLV